MDQVFQVSGLRGFEAIALSLTAKSREFAAAGLNNMAFAFREQAPKVLGGSRTIRDQRFVQGRFLVTKAQASQGMKMFAQVGSIKSKRFSGWEEDYGEGSTKRGLRDIGKNARGGSMTGKVKQQFRLSDSIDFPTLDKGAFAGIKGNHSQRVAAMISMIARHPDLASSTKGLFILPAHQFYGGVFRINPTANRFLKKKTKGIIGKALLRSPAIQVVQRFNKTNKMRKLDWAHMTMAIIENKRDIYFSDAFKKIMNS